jgi:3'(2'), 5'-bisphosphate nucleotidase
LIAAGEGDLYPRFGPTMEWDTAAGDAVLTAAGGAMLDLKGQAFLYGKISEGCRNCGFMAMGDRGLAVTLF